MPLGAKLPPSERVCGRSQNRLKRQPVCFGQKNTHKHTDTHTNEHTLTCTHSTDQRPIPDSGACRQSLSYHPPEHPAQDSIFLLWPVFKLVFLVQCFECLFVKHDKQDMAGLLKEKRKSFSLNSLSANGKVHVKMRRAN